MDWLNKLAHAVLNAPQQVAGWVGHEAQQLPQQVQQAAQQVQHYAQPAASALPRAIQMLQQTPVAAPKQLQQIQALRNINFNPNPSSLAGFGNQYGQVPTFLDIYNNTPFGAFSHQTNPFELNNDDSPTRGLASWQQTNTPPTFLDMYNATRPGLPGGPGMRFDSGGYQLDSTDTPIPTEAYVNGAGGVRYPGTLHAENERPYRNTVNVYTNPNQFYPRNLSARGF